MGECTTTQIDRDLVQSLTLALVYSRGPCQANRELNKTSNDILNHSAFITVIAIAMVVPLFLIEYVPSSIDLYKHTIVNETSDSSNGPINPTLARVILHHHDFCSNFK